VYQYSGLDKVASISEGEKVISNYQYSISGQLASATTDGATENFLWDGLALIRRGDTDYTNEPYVTGGNPLLSNDGKIMFNDVLGNTVGIKSEDKLKLIQMTAFGETADKDAFFTGKPAVNNLGYSFLFRNYRADQGKWLSQDPIALTVTLPSPESSGAASSSAAQLGYPDGWNNLAYGNNSFVMGVDTQGTEWVLVSDSGAAQNYTTPITIISQTPGTGMLAPRRQIQYTVITYNFVGVDNYYHPNANDPITWIHYDIYDRTETTITQWQYRSENNGIYYDMTGPDDRTTTTVNIPSGYSRCIVRTWE